MSNFKNNRNEVIDTLITAHEYFENLADINDNGGPNTEMSLQMGIADILHYMGVPGYTSHREAVDPSYVKGALDFGNSTMNESKNRFTVTESEKERILNQHISRGYKTPINESEENELNEFGLDEQGGAIGNAARSAAIQGGLAKQGNSVPQQLIDWLKKNNVKNGQWSKDLKNPQKIVVSYLPPSTLGSSKLVPLVSIYKPSTVSTDNGKWEFNGTTVIFK